MRYRHLDRPTFGVLAGWQYYWTATPLSYLDPIFRGLGAAALERQCNLLFACGMGSSASLADPRRPAWPFASDDADFVPVGPWNTDGLIVVNPLLNARRSEDIARLRATGFPVLFVGAGEDGPTVMADNAGGVDQAMRHLTSHGHRQIAFIAGSPADLAGDTGERLRAFECAVRDLALADDPRLLAYGEHVFDGGYRAMQAILGTGVPFTGVLASNDESALGALQALREAGRDVPRDVALVGFDDRPQSALATPALTSVQVPLFRMGYQALELMERFVAAGRVPNGPFKAATRLVVRESCGCAHRYGAESGGAPHLATAADLPAALARAMAEAATGGAQVLALETADAMCGGLIAALQADLRSPAGVAFLTRLDAALTETESVGETDLNLWQAPLTLIQQALPRLIPGRAPRVDRRRAEGWLDQGRQLISERIQRANRVLAAEQRALQSDVGRLTAHLQEALDEDSVVETLARYLPEMGARLAAVALFSSVPAGDPDGWSELRLLGGPDIERVRCQHRNYPPEEFCPTGRPFRLAVIPLVHQSGQVGYMAFEAERMVLYGAIAQQVAAALNSARLFQAAREGRRLAEEATRLKSRFLSTVSHELRTPLNLVVGTSELLLRRSAALPDDARKDVERIQSSAQHLGWLIRDVLDLASNEAGKLRLNSEFLELALTLRPVADIGRQMALDKGLAWRESMPAEPVWVWGDRTRLRQVVLNLLHNAVKFTSRGAVHLIVETDGESAVVRAQDTGMGIPPAEQHVIFDEFRRTDQAMARGYGGLGLGLAICKLLVDMHGGTIGVQSAGDDGGGATFSFRLPRVDATRLNSVAPGEGDRVFVIAQRKARGELLLAQLRTRGLPADAIWLDETPNWIEPLTQAAPGAVALDVGLSPAIGWDIFRALKGHPQTQKTPVFFLALDGERGGALELDYATKPIGPGEIDRVLQPHTQSGNPAQKTILVVDDDLATLELHARLVKSRLSGCRVLTARDGTEALACLEREKPDLVLLDLVMPRLDGFGLLEAMRKSAPWREIPVVVITGQALTEAEMDRLNRGVATVLEKELFSVEEVLNHVESALMRQRKLGTETQRLVRHAMAYIHENFAEPLTREALARHVSMSGDYLTASFRKELGMTPVAYINRCRVNQARTLLKSTGQSVAEIAAAVGFADSGYFARVFKREVGQSPERYRRAPGL